MILIQGFDDELKRRDIFLDISKEFDKVWHEGFIYKLPRNVICDNLSQLLLTFLDSRKQRGLLNCKCSS